MPRLIALEWTAAEARVAVATTKGERCLIEHAFLVPLVAEPPADAPPEAGHQAGHKDKPVEKDKSAEKDKAHEPPDDPIGRQILAALSNRGIARLDAVVSIGRTNTELRQMSLPPAPDDDLPDLVRLQAAREFNAIDDSWRLDFISVEDQAGQPRSVLAAAIDGKLVQQVQHVCDTAGLRLKHMVLRPCGAAALVDHLRPDWAEQPRLLLDLLGDEADLTVTVDHKVRFLRTARLPGDPLRETEATQALFGEIRRTIAAAHNQMGERRIVAVVVCGSGPQQEHLAQALQTALGMRVDMLDPLAGFELGPELIQSRPEYPGRFAPLLGMLLDEAGQRRHAIDFLNPRRRPPPPNRRRQYILAGVLVGALLLGWLGWQKKQQQDLLHTQGILQARLEARDKQLTDANKVSQTANEIGAWAKSQINWLDELYLLSGQIPPAQDVMLSQLSLDSSMARGVSEIELKGLARSPKDIDELEAHLRDATHGVEGLGSSQDAALKGYGWRFRSRIVVNQEKPASAEKTASGTQAATAPAEKPPVGRGRSSSRSGGRL